MSENIVAVFLDSKAFRERRFASDVGQVSQFGWLAERCSYVVEHEMGCYVVERKVRLITQDKRTAMINASRNFIVTWFGQRAQIHRQISLGKGPKNIEACHDK